MRKRVLYLVKWNHNSVLNGGIEENSFLRDARDMIKVNPQFETKFGVDSLKNSMSKWKGVKEGVGLHLQIATLVLLTALCQKIPTTFLLFSANMNSTSTMTQTCRKI